MDANAQFALAYALSTTAGLRAFMTLLAASVAAHLGWIHPSTQFAWLGSTGATTVLAVATILELLADKIPLVDHLLHVVSFALRPLAAAILVGSTVHTQDERALYAMMAVGALNALIVHGSAATARAGSTVATFGLGNAVLSFGEDGVALGGIILAFFKPLIAAVLAVAFVIALMLATRLVVGRVRAGLPRRER